MKKTITTCDVCGKEIVSEIYGANDIVAVGEDRFDDSLPSIFEQLNFSTYDCMKDFCRECVDTISTKLSSALQNICYEIEVYSTEDN
jgi:hypothetical protein